jgi:hypothetical protein
MSFIKRSFATEEKKLIFRRQTYRQTDRQIDRQTDRQTAVTYQV